jgi:hypothetical protein
MCNSPELTENGRFRKGYQHKAAPVSGNGEYYVITLYPFLLMSYSQICGTGDRPAMVHCLEGRAAIYFLTD